MIGREHQQLADALGADPEVVGWDDMIEYVRGLEFQRIRLNRQLDALRRRDGEQRNRRLRTALLLSGVSPELVNAIEWDIEP